MTTPLRITTSQTLDGTRRLTAAGEIDISNITEFTTRLGDCVGPDHRLVVDLTGVTYLDSAALAALFKHAKHIAIEISPLNETLFSFSGLGQLTTVRVVATGDDHSVDDRPSGAG